MSVVRPDPVLIVHSVHINAAPVKESLPAIINDFP